jgi:tRNA-dihydrouridine synthase B
VEIGPYKLASNVILAPMAGITDRPFRQLCRSMGAGLAVSEMVTSNSLLYGSVKTRRRADHAGEPSPVSVQIAGADPILMAEAARVNVAGGAEIIDINMGCPAKKVCNVSAGSALLRDEELVGRILEAVVRAVDAPVTLKIRTGWDKAHRNALRVARIAEQAGIRALAVHGRTRACMFGGEAEYETIAAVKAAIGIPVIANGDIDGPEKARRVLESTGADGVMIGRAALGYPWIFREVCAYLAAGQRTPPPAIAEVHRVLLAHLDALHSFYGERAGVPIARKHVGWFTKGLPGSAAFRHAVFQLASAAEQRAAVDRFFSKCDARTEPRAPSPQYAAA